MQGNSYDNTLYRAHGISSPTVVPRKTSKVMSLLGGEGVHGCVSVCREGGTG